MPSNSTVEGVNNGSTEDRASISSIALLDQVARLKKLYELSMTLAGDPIEVFRHVARMIGELLNVKVVCLSEVRGSELYFLAVYVDGQIFSDAGRCPLEITPCATVEQSKDFRVYDRVMERFPEATFLAQYNAFSYCGFPALDNNGNVVAVTCLLDDKPHDFTSDDEEMLRIFGQRIGMEIERHKHIEARKQSEQMLRESEANLRALAENAGEGILINSDGRHVFANRRMAQMLGYRIEELLGTTIQDVVHPDERERVRETFSQRMAGSKVPERYETVFADKTGGKVPVEVSATTTVWQGKPAGLVFVRDITKRLLAESQMRQLSSAIEQTADNVIITNPDGIIQYVNPAFEKTTGYTREEAVGKKPSLVKSDQHEQAFYEQLWNTILRGDVVHERFINRRKDGSQYYEEKYITPILDNAGHITHFISTGRDITERLLAENENRRMQAFLNSVVENLPNMLFVKDAKELRFVRFNRAAEELLGYSRDELLGKNDYDFFPKEEAEFFTSKDRQVLNSAQLQDIPEEPIHTKHKGVRLLHTKKIPIMDETGKPLYLLGISEDITERKRVEEALAQSAVEWTYSMDFIEDAMYLIDADDIVIRANRAFYQLMGLSPDQTIGRDITSIMHPQGESAPCRVCEARRGRRNCHIIMEPQDPDNPTGRPIEIVMRVIRDAASAPTGVLMVIRDLTHIRETERVLRESATSLANAQRIAHIGNWERNVTTNEIRWSDETYRIFGLTPQQPGITYKRFSNLIHPEDRQSVMETVNKAINDKQPYSTDYRIIRPDGAERIVHAQAEIICANDGKADRIIGTVQDITERKDTEARLNYLAHYDTLTGLPNRVLLYDRLNQAMIEVDRVDRLVAVMFLDLDRFKLINDTLGHDVGDALLRRVAERLAGSVRHGDTVSRLGGDEFTVVLANVAHVDDIARVAQKIIDSFIPPFNIDGRELFISTSIGITLYPFDDNNIDSLLRNADAAMYHAKEMGRNTFQFYTAELNRRTAKRLQLETALRHALERDELRLHYQPQVDLKTGRITGVEALLRWQHPEMGLIPPLDFIPLAEETGLIIPIGEWVLNAACKQARVWHDTGAHNLQVAVNLSGRQFQHRNLAKTVKKTLKETGLDPRTLDLELTESILMHNTEATLATMNELNALGVMFSMDDFGTGYSSLSYLKRFPIDTLKIDQSFVRDIPRDPDDAAIAQAIVAMAHSLGIQVIAEGVETAKQLAFLRANKCDGMQGYYFSKPVTAAKMARLLQKNHRLTVHRAAAKPRAKKRKGHSN